MQRYDSAELIRSFEEHYNIRLPKYKIVCPRCDGNGTHGNPAFDGTTVEWWLDGDPDGDDLNEYLHGTRYDVPCEVCRGANVINTVDIESLKPDVLQEWEEWEQAAWDDYMTWRAETAYGY